MVLRGEHSIHISEPLNYAASMLAAALLMALCWSFLRLPHGNVLMTTFCFLSASVLHRIPDGWKRFRRILPMAFSAGLLQFLIGICREEKLLLAVIPAAVSAGILRYLRGKGAACSMCIVGFLAFFAPGGWQAAADRACGIALGIPIVLLASALFHSELPEKEGKDICFSWQESLRLGFLLGLGIWLTEALKLGQGAWIMLTMLFICQYSIGTGCYSEASLERIIGTPAGLLLGGVFLGTFAFFDYRFIYLLFPLGALGFYLLRKNGDFFLFTVFFMLTFSIYADWAAGDVHRFHFADLFMQRTAATLIGSLFMILYDSMRRKDAEK